MPSRPCAAPVAAPVAGGLCARPAGAGQHAGRGVHEMHALHAAAAAREPRGDLRARAAEDEGGGEGAAAVLQPLHQPLSHLVLQGGGRASRRSAASLSSCGGAGRGAGVGAPLGGQGLPLWPAPLPHQEGVWVQRVLCRPVALPGLERPAPGAQRCCSARSYAASRPSRDDARAAWKPPSPQRRTHRKCPWPLDWRWRTAPPGRWPATAPSPGSCSGDVWMPAPGLPWRVVGELMLGDQLQAQMMATTISQVNPPLCPVQLYVARTPISSAFVQNKKSQGGQARRKSGLPS